MPLNEHISNQLVAEVRFSAQESMNFDLTLTQNIFRLEWIPWTNLHRFQMKDLLQQTLTLSAEI